MSQCPSSAFVAPAFSSSDGGGGGGSPAGSAGALQFNNAGAFGGVDVLSVVDLTTLGADGLVISAIGSGLQIGQVNTDMIGLWGATPVAQPAAVADIGLNSSISGGDTVDVLVLTANFSDIQSKINDILAKLRSPGFIAS